MKLGKKTLITVIVVSASLILSVIAFATGQAYDSATDPLIAQSYLDARLNAQKTEYETIINALTARIEALEANGGTGGGTGTGAVNSPSAAFKSVTLAKGDTVYPKSGQLEIIVRSGGAVAIVPEGKTPLVNVTNGTDLTDGKILYMNHFVMVPAAEGVGLKVASSTGAEILIRGEYTVEYAE